MAQRPGRRFHKVRALLLVFATASLASATDSFPPGRYRITTETGMPHLEENLRYSVTRAERCLSQEDLPKVFPVLQHPSLQACRLDHEMRDEQRITYALSCDGGQGTTGEAVWQLGERQLTGTLNVKLGGKNMTFYQRVTAMLLGPCA